MNRRTIVLTQFPFTDLTTTKRRPALVLSPSESAEGDIVVAFITSRTERMETKTDFLLDANDDSFDDANLKKPSLIKLGKLATLNKSIFTGELGFLHEETMRRINEKLRTALGL